VFVIRDYKSRVVHRPRRRRKTRRLLVAASVLVATLGIVKFLDLNASTAPVLVAPTSSDLVSVPLELPGARTTSASDAERPSTIAGPAASAPLPPTLRDADRQPMERLAESMAIGIIIQEPATAERAASTDTTAAQPSLLATLDTAPVGEATDPVEPDPTASAVEPVETTPAVEPVWLTHAVESGESLAKIFAAQGLEPGLLHRIVNSSKQAKSLARIRPGQILRFRFDDTGELTTLEHHRSRTEHMRVAVTDDGVLAELISKSVDKRTASAAGVIESSLFVDGQKAGLSDAKIMELAEIFGWDIDFALELRAGDQFRLVYEEHYLDGEKLRDGPILAAEFTNRGKTFKAVRYESQDGEIGYFDDTGHSKRRAFLRTPIKFARISSRFNPKRWHPVLKRWRSHNGVDYAAPTGTPIKASGDGKIIFRGTKGGYGRTVIIQHAGKYTTLYAHMSKYSKRARSGARVKQGQVIGYVGKSGLATGPHLHYEFRINGKHKDPLRVKLPKSLALPKKELPDFKAATAPLLAQLENVSPETMVASAGPAN
jgi:murein DD-endopeptidase MepM/ murein hydrolase activator NlpD